MKKIIGKTLLSGILLAILSAFSMKPGGEGFEIYVNNTLVLQQFGKSMDNVKSLSLGKYDAKDELVIKYHHCGQTGKNRIVTIKDEDDKVLKSFRFTDVNTPVSRMKVKIGDIVTLKKGSTGTLRIYYSSTELPKGRMLATIPPTGNSISKN